MIGRLVRRPTRLSKLVGRRMQSGPGAAPKDEWNPKVKLGFQIAAPVLAVASFTGTIVWHHDFRYFLERYMPSLVDFVRRHVGFDDEDPVERQRVADLLALQDEPVEMIVHTIDGQIETVKVEGNKSFADVYYGVLQDNSVPFALGTFEFVDARGGSAIPDNSEQERAHRVAMMDPKSLQNVVERETDDVQSIRVANWVKDLWTQEAAEWTQVPHEESAAQESGSDIFAQRPLGKSSRGGNGREQKQSAASIEKEAAQARIAELQEILQQLEAEKTIGTRSIDDIEEDIAAAKKEIAHLKRTYINWFYYF